MHKGAASGPATAWECHALKSSCPFRPTPGSAAPGWTHRWLAEARPLSAGVQRCSTTGSGSPAHPCAVARLHRRRSPPYRPRASLGADSHLLGLLLRFPPPRVR